MTSRCPRCTAVLDEGPVLYRCARCQRAVPAADVDVEFVPRTHATTGARR
jgi:tRNA(Ile2) C34 agmatinyltransferase TiaS